MGASGSLPENDLLEERDSFTEVRSIPRLGRTLVGFACEPDPAFDTTRLTKLLDCHVGRGRGVAVIGGREAIREHCHEGYIHNNIHQVNVITHPATTRNGP